MNPTYLFLSWLALLAVATSCEELVDVSAPRSTIPSAIVFEDDLTAVGATSILYYEMAQNSFRDITYLTSLSADELMIESGDALEAGQFYHNEVSSINSLIELAWRTGYKTIYNANSIIEGLEKSEKLSAALKDQLMGEAKFFRAFSHFYLVNLFGDVPYITTTDYQINRLASRMAVAGVYEKIIADLAEARTLLSEDYSYAKNERVRVNKWAATAMLARVYLYTEDWVHAEEQASLVIDKTSLYKLGTNLDEVFLKNNQEAIWQLIPAYPQDYTPEGLYLNKPFYNVNNPTIPQELFNAFEAGDKRKANWIGIGNGQGHTWYYLSKYKETILDTVGADEYSTVFRLAEQYLIRAEAKAKQDKLTGSNSAASDLNIIRSRAGLAPTLATTKQELLSAIEHERRTELFLEWGHRWLDLKRTGRATTVLSLVKPNWQETDVLYPIPYSELQLNPKMTQNLNY